MPLIVLSGILSSGKTNRALELYDYFVYKRNKKVHLISENSIINKAGFNKNDYYSDPNKEKQIRSDMKSNVVRWIDSSSVIILDACNYIKGFRYELYCATKMANSTQCTVFCATSKEQAWKFNVNRSIRHNKSDNQMSSIEGNILDIPDEILTHFEGGGDCKSSLEDLQKMPWYQCYIQKRKEQLATSKVKTTECQVPTKQSLKSKDQHQNEVNTSKLEALKIEDEGEKRGVASLENGQDKTNKSQEIVSENTPKGPPSENLKEVKGELTNSSLPYTRECFDGLCMRYEEPQSTCRWDNPLFIVYPNDHLDLDAIYNALFERVRLVPNQSTQNAPLSSANYLYELDRLTQEAVNEMLATLKVNTTGSFKIKNCSIPLKLPSNINAIKLNLLRRQFLHYNKLHYTTAYSNSTKEVLTQLFVQFVNANVLENK